MKKIRRKAIRSMILFGLVAALMAGTSMTAFAAGNISRKTAISIAAKDAEVSSSSSKFKLTEAELDRDDGRTIWEIEFYYNGTKYEYDINAKTKKIIKKDKEISKSKVKKLALKRADVKSKNVKSWDIDHEDDRNYFRVIMKTSSNKYTMRIHSGTGKVLSYKKTAIKKAASKYIGVDKAKSIALAHAKKNASITGNVRYEKAKLEKDDGQVYYEIEFKNGNYEFDYEIHATSGRILDWDIDYDD